ncbi:ORF6N domain-containing protein [Sporosarcina sp. FSL K6-1522]|uniref:ORF6N domain-containing protein n=1 Tax=Sporosarcina sp. FSL K6-1522 TaxID=2921554 RepID=UPI00315A4FD1
MQQLQVVEHSDMRVLTTAQLAESYGTQSKIITRNFQRNEKQYVPGIHYIALTGEDLKRFKGERPNDASLKYVSNLYLWTEQGAWMHAKSLKSDSAWEAYSKLINGYYLVSAMMRDSAVDVSKTPTITHEQIYQIESRLEAVEQQLRDSLTLHSGEQRRLRIAVGERVHQLVSNKGARPALFRSLYSSIRERYNVDSYRDVKQHELQDALIFISRWGQ